MAGVSEKIQDGEKKKKKITPQSAKAKGRRLQQWVCKKVAEITGFEWGSNGNDKPIESRPMGQSGTDIRMESSVLKKFPFSVECKWQESWAIPAWIQQAKANLIKNTNWLLVIKKSRENPIVVLDAQVFFDLIAKVLEVEND